MRMPVHQVSPPGAAAQWPYHSFLPLGALPGAVPCARLHTTAVLWEWDMEALSQPVHLDDVTDLIGVGRLGTAEVEVGHPHRSGAD